jgi:hypothetical protein
MHESEIKAVGPLFRSEKYLNLFVLNNIYKQVVRSSYKQFSGNGVNEEDVSSGIWGGTYLIADESGFAKNKIKRMYCIVNLPQDKSFEDKEELKRFMEMYYQTSSTAFKPLGLDFKLEGWGDPLPYSNRSKPSLIMHLSEAKSRVLWLRVFFVWNSTTWEESIIYDSIRNLKVLKELLNLDSRPIKKDSEELKFLMQDVIIVYRTLQKALNPDFVDHAEPIIKELIGHYLAGLYDSELIWELYLTVFNSAILYGLEETLEAGYAKAGLDIHKFEEWPLDKINWVPDDLKNKLIPPIQELFRGFRENLGVTE